MYREHTVAAVVPAYNEEETIGRVIQTLPEYIDRAYVIDDGSTDETYTEIQQHAASRNETHEGVFDDLVVPIQHPENRGVGGAIKSGYLRARDDEIQVTVVLGGDDQMDPSEIPRYLDPIVEGTAEYAKGNRFSRPSDWADMPRFRLVGNVVLSYLTKIASGYWHIMDSQNGYTAISLAALQRADIEGMYEYYGYCNDLLIRLNVAGVTVADVPRSSTYAYSDGWTSHIEITEYVPRVSGMLLRGFFRRLYRKYLLSGYDPLAPLYLLGIGVMGAGLGGMLGTILRRTGKAGSWFQSFLAGMVMFLYASMRDASDNEGLEVQLQRGQSETPDSRTEVTDASETRESRTEGRHSPGSPRSTRAEVDGGTESRGQSPESATESNTRETTNE